MRRQGLWASLKPLLGPISNGVFVLLIVVALVLVLDDKREDRSIIRGAFDDAVTPVMDVVAAPFRGLRAVLHDLDGYREILTENQKLNEENARLRHWYARAQAQATLLRRYEALLDLKIEPAVETVTARVIAETGGPFVQAKLTNVGSLQGVRQGQSAITEHGLMGRVVGVGETSARILLLTDSTSRIPVMVARTDARGLLSGDLSPAPKLELIRGRNMLQQGDMILTSGDGLLMPRGLPVGQAYLARDGSWRVRLYTDRGPGDFIKILKAADFAEMPDANDPTQQIEILAPEQPIPANPAPRFETPEPQPTPVPDGVNNTRGPVAPNPRPAPSVPTPDPYPDTVTVGPGPAPASQQDEADQNTRRYRGPP